MIGQRETFVDVTPCAKDEQEWNPPRSRCPEEEGEAFDEWIYIGKEGGVAFEEDVRTRKGGDGDRAHVDPVRRREFLRVNLEEHETIKDERNDQDVEHAAKQVKA